MRTAYLDALYEIAKNDKNVFALIGDNGIIVYDKFREDIPRQFLNMGISEAHMVGFAAGIASRGKIPFVYTIGAFLTGRAYEFIKDSVCFQNLNVKLIGTGAGEIYSRLGATHHATEDIGALRSIPGLVIINPASPMEVRKATYSAYKYSGPVYIRLGTNKEKEIYDTDYDFEIGKAVTVREGKDLTIISTGYMVSEAVEISEYFERRGIYVRVINIHTLSPFDNKTVIKAIDETDYIIALEDHNKIGGLGSAVSEVIAEYGKGVRYRRIGLVTFSEGYGDYEELKEMNGIGKSSVIKFIEEWIK